MTKKYTWDFNKEAETWYNATFDTVQECINDAKESVKNKDYDCCFDPKTQNTIYVAETAPYTPTVDIENMFDQMLDEAGANYGESADAWEPYSWRKEPELEELQSEIDEVVIEWLKTNDRYPTFYGLDNIKEYSLEVKDEL